MNMEGIRVDRAQFGIVFPYLKRPSYVSILRLSARRHESQPPTLNLNHEMSSSLPRADYDPRRIFLISCPSLPFFKHRRAFGVYTAGALVSIHYLCDHILRVTWIIMLLLTLYCFSLPLPMLSSLTPVPSPHTQSLCQMLHMILPQCMLIS